VARVDTRVWADWLDAGLSRRERRPCRYDAYIPDPLADVRLHLPSDVAADVSDAERAIHDLNASGPRLASLDALARLLLRAEAVASSHIEGLEVGVGRLARAEAAAGENQSINDVTAEAVLGNIRAMELTVSQLASKTPLAVEDVLAIHAALMERTTTQAVGGQVRTSQNWIGGNDLNPCGADFVPPPPELVPDLLADLVEFLNEADHPPLVQAALAHAQFETIHPFADGNGRVGRTLIHLVLRRRGLAPRYVPPISLVFATESRTYIAGLTAYRYIGPPGTPLASERIANWIATFASAATRATADARQLELDIDALEQQWRLQAAPVRKNSAADLLLGMLASAPVITVRTAEKFTGRTFQAVDLAIHHLVRAGVLKQITVGRRNRAFEAVGLLDALTTIERRLASPARDTREAPVVRRVPYRRSAPADGLR